jgi:hypothetical protein
MIQAALRNDLKIELPHLPTKRFIKSLYSQARAMCLVTKCICNDVGLAWMIVYVQIIILDKL